MRLSGDKSPLVPDISAHLKKGYLFKDVLMIKQSCKIEIVSSYGVEVMACFLPSIMNIMQPWGQG